MEAGVLYAMFCFRDFTENMNNFPVSFKNNL